MPGCGYKLEEHTEYHPMFREVKSGRLECPRVGCDFSIGKNRRDELVKKMEQEDRGAGLGSMPRVEGEENFAALQNL